MTAKVVAPKLRFKNSGGEDFPEALPRKFNQITDKISDGIHSTPTYSESGDYYFVNGNNLINGQIVITPSTKKIDRSQYEIHKSDLNDRSILISINGTIGNLAFYKGEEVVLGKSACYINLKIGENKKYVYQLLQTEKIKNYFGQELTGSTIKNLSLTTIKNALAHFPSEEEQTKIANFLTAVDTKISQLTKKHELLTSYKKGVMQKIFSQELRFKDDGGREFAEWEHKPISETLTIGSGRDYKHLGPGLIPVYGTGGFMLSVDDFLYDGVSVCIGRKGTIDKPVLLSGKFWTVDTLFYTHNFIKCIPEFIYVCFQTINWKQYCEASGVPSLSKSTIEKIEINLPCIQEQTKIANLLTAIDDKITNVKSQLEATKEYKQGLLQQMFV